MNPFLATALVVGIAVSACTGADSPEDSAKRIALQEILKARPGAESPASLKATVTGSNAKVESHSPDGKTTCLVQLRKTGSTQLPPWIATNVSCSSS
ncbi:hypothetical protein LC612_31860 [Nostoc sp. CHAB 5834]|nr:hypothetical protein [Nostoc sp. CHAB 5834]